MDDVKIKRNKNFRRVLEFLRERPIAVPDEVADGLNMKLETVEKYFDTAQAEVAAEMDAGELYNEGVEKALDYGDYLITQKLLSADLNEIKERIESGQVLHKYALYDEFGVKSDEELFDYLNKHPQDKKVIKVQMIFAIYVAYGEKMGYV